MSELPGQLELVTRAEVTARQLEQLLELKRAAWDAMPDYGSDRVEDRVTLARFTAICDVCRIFGVNDFQLPAAAREGSS